MTQSILAVGSELTFNTVNTHLAHLHAALSGHTDATVTLDLDGVTACDSAGLALLIEMKRWCVKQKKQLNLVSVPSLIVALAQFCGVNDLLQEQ